MTKSRQKTFLRLVGLAGSILFWTFFAVTFVTPESIETFAKDYIERKAAERIDETVDDLGPEESDSALLNLAQSMLTENEDRIRELKDQLRLRIHEQIADAIAEIRDLDCECRDRIARFLEEGYQGQILMADAANDRIVEFIHYKYMELVSELKRDIRIFTASNGGAFLVLLLISFVKPRAIVHLFVPGVLLAASTIICSYFYIFEQNWLLTIIHSAYLGFVYLGWLGFVFLFLCDIVLNRGRVTTQILNAIGSMIGNAATVLPC